MQLFEAETIWSSPKCQALHCIYDDRFCLLYFLCFVWSSFVWNVMDLNDLKWTRIGPRLEHDNIWKEIFPKDVLFLTLPYSSLLFLNLSSFLQHVHNLKARSLQTSNSWEEGLVEHQVLMKWSGRRGEMILESRRVELLTQNNHDFCSIELVQRWDWREWFDREYFQYNFFKIVLLKIRI